MSSKPSFAHYKKSASEIHDTSLSENSLQYFCTAVSPAYPFDMLVNTSNAQMAQYPSTLLHSLSFFFTEYLPRYFRCMLNAFSSHPFYTKYVKLPAETDPPASRITSDSRYTPYFIDALGAIDGTHINSAPSAAERDFSQNRKGSVTQNCLIACSFDLAFIYVLSGMDGSVADANLFNEARFVNLHIPPGKFYLADAGFVLSKQLLIPYRGVRYHLQEWCRGNAGPRNREELFNLQHSALRNVIERIFGIVKRRFRILVVPAEYDMDVQARIPPALCAIHNLIYRYDPDDVLESWETSSEVSSEQGDDLAESIPSRGVMREAAEWRDVIAEQMWWDYLRIMDSRVE